jgi:hypothetical protein
MRPIPSKKPSPSQFILFIIFLLFVSGTKKKAETTKKLSNTLRRFKQIEETMKYNVLCFYLLSCRLGKQKK